MKSNQISPCRGLYKSVQRKLQSASRERQERALASRCACWVALHALDGMEPAPRRTRARAREI
eukprot:768044-Pleurochrysis_carterae.AAC.1